MTADSAASPLAPATAIDQAVAASMLAQQAAIARSRAIAANVRKLIETGTPDSLRNELRRAHEGRDAVLRVMVNAEEDLARAQQALADARAEVSAFAALDDELDAAALAAFRAGTLGEAPPPELGAKLSARDAARGRLDAAERVDRKLTASLAEATIAAGARAEEVETLAAALVGALVDRVAGALEEAEERAANLRGIVKSLAEAWLAAPGATAAQPMPLTDRARRLLTNPPANARAAIDKAIGEAFRAHFVALLTDADATLANEMGWAE